MNICVPSFVTFTDVIIQAITNKTIFWPFLDKYVITNPNIRFITSQNTRKFDLKFLYFWDFKFSAALKLSSDTVLTDGLEPQLMSSMFEIE